MNEVQPIGTIIDSAASSEQVYSQVNLERATLLLHSAGGSSEETLELAQNINTAERSAGKHSNSP